MSLQRQLLVMFCCLLSVGFLFKAGFLTIQRFLIIPSNSPLQAQAQSTGQIDAEAWQATALPPQKLFIPDIKVDLPIIPTPLVKNEWEVTTQGVSLLQPTQSDVHAGYILYGHNWPSLLGNIHKLKIGQRMYLSYLDQPYETYQIVSIFSVTPDRLEVLNLAKPNTIVLYTCTGFLDSQRLVIVAQKQ